MHTRFLKSCEVKVGVVNLNTPAQTISHLFFGSPLHPGIALSVMPGLKIFLLLRGFDSAKMLVSQSYKIGLQKLDFELCSSLIQTLSVPLLKDSSCYKR